MPKLKIQIAQKIVVYTVGVLDWPLHKPTELTSIIQRFVGFVESCSIGVIFLIFHQGLVNLNCISILDKIKCC